MRSARGEPGSVAILVLAVLLLCLTSGAAEDQMKIGQGRVPEEVEPTFEYETVITGYYLASGRGIVSDSNGNAYVFARTIANHQNDIVVAKLDPEGAILWEKPITGDDHDYAEDMILDSAGNLLIVGWTDSENFPVTPDAMNSVLVVRDAFLMKMSPLDGTILYCTFLGGDYVDAGNGITLNSDGEIYIVGTTGSTDFPTVNAYQSEPSAPLYIYTDAFVTKLNPAGTSILYSTYFGGFKDDEGKYIALDHQGNIILAGTTNADDFPLSNPIQTTPNPIFVSQLSADGSTLEFSTYLGGEDRDTLRGMVADSQGSVYITGSTRSVDYPTTPGVFQDGFVGAIYGCYNSVPPYYYNCEDVYVTKLKTDGSGFVYSTFLAGTHIDESGDIALDRSGSVYVSGYTYSSDFPLGGPTTGTDMYVSKFNADASALEYTVDVSSGSANTEHGVTVDDAGNVFFTGAIHVPAEIYVARLSSTLSQEIFSDDFESGDLSAWSLVTGE